ncbi:uncharacterized protein METZ01_LOCUS443887, partial [marine metagenome]
VKPILLFSLPFVRFKRISQRLVVFLFAAASSLVQGKDAPPASISGVYPSLTMYNEEGECGTGAVVPWAGRLWVITYGPHKP